MVEELVMITLLLRWVFNIIHLPYNLIIIGLKDDIDSIKGFEEAWKDTEHPVFSCKDHPSWRSIVHKYTRWHYNFTNGNAYFVIPPYPFKGESIFKFLTISNNKKLEHITSSSHVNFGIGSFLTVLFFKKKKC